jgi:putative addiction module killer protein
VYSLQQTDVFALWLSRLRDDRARARIVARIRRAGLGHLGDARSVGGKVFEMRVDFGPGYRIYFTRRGERIILLLCGGDKSSQRRDIKRAVALAADLED